jgi:hypothetical protein
MKNRPNFLKIDTLVCKNKAMKQIEREIRPFELIRDFNRRILLTTDVEPVTTYKGIQKMNVIDWLLKEENNL